MSQSWKRRRWGSFAPVCEQLEARETPAGNLSVGVVNGVLTIRADDNGTHALNISGTSRDSIAIRTNPGTTINGSSQEVIFVGGITRGYDVQLGDGADSIVFSNVNAQDYLSVRTGGGDDVIHIVGGTHSRNSTWVLGGDGNDVLIVSSSTFRKHFDFVGGAGNDRVEVGLGNDFDGAIRFDGGDGSDTLNKQSNRFRGAPAVLNFETNGSTVAAPVPAGSLIPGPTASGDTGTVAQNKSTTINVLGNDTVGSGTFNNSTLRVTSGPSKGTATVNSDGTITYTSTGAAGTDSFRYFVANSDGRTSNETTVTITVTDGTGPTGTITSTTTSPTRTTPIDYKVEFSESVTEFVAGDVTISGGTLTSGSFTGSGTTYNFTVTPSGDGTVSVSVAAGVAKDSAGNTNQAITAITRTFDSTAPTVTLSSTTSANTNVTPIPITATFSESVSGFEAADIVVTGGTLGTVSGSGTTYTFTVTPTGDGTVTVNVAANAATDAAGNTSTVATALTRTFDGTAPTGTITSSAPATTGTSPIPFTLTFSEVVSGFVQADITVSGGTIGGFTTTDSKVYTFTVTPTADGVVTVSAAAGVAADAAGNTSTAVAAVSRTFDTQSPNVTISSSTTSPTKVNPIPFTAEFSKDVSDFVVGDITVTNGTASNFVAVDGNTYTFDVTPANQGDVTVSIAAGVATGNGKDNLASTPVTRVFDTVAPTGQIDTLRTNDKTPTITGLLFEETASVSVVVNGQTVAATVNPDDLTWSATLTTELADGSYTIAATFTDAAGNVGSALQNNGLIIDTVAPTASSSSSKSSPTNAAVIPFTISFSEAVQDFVIGDITVAGGTASNFVAAANKQTYTFDVTPSADGNVSVSLAANIATDKAGNGNTALAPLVIVSDRTGPAFTITTTASNPSNLSAIPFKVAVSEDVSDFTIDDLVISNGVAGAFTKVTSSEYTFTVTPDAEGPVTVTIDAAVATDALGNTSTAAGPVSVTSDRLAPTVTLTSTEGSPSKADSYTATATFSEVVSGFDLNDITVVRADLSNIQTTDNKVFTFTVTPNAEGNVNISVGAGKVNDTAGNGNAASATLSIFNDENPPNILVSAVGTTSISGTGIDGSGITDLDISIFDGTNYWDGTGFTSATEVFLQATSGDNFQNWSYAFSVAGTYTVKARAVDEVGFESTNTQTVVIS